MVRESKAAYSEKQKHQTQPIEEGYEERAIGKGETETSAWPTVNKLSEGVERSASGQAATRQGGSHRQTD